MSPIWCILGIYNCSSSELTTTVGCGFQGKWFPLLPAESCTSISPALDIFSLLKNKQGLKASEFKGLFCKLSRIYLNVTLIQAEETLTISMWHLQTPDGFSGTTYHMLTGGAHKLRAHKAPRPQCSSHCQVLFLPDLLVVSVLCP